MTKYALLIGINNYPIQSGLTPLRFAERDAAELGKVLESRCGFKTRTLLGRQATTVAVQEALHESARGDTFLFFFAGHGQEIKGQYCLHPVDSKATGVNSIPFETFARHWEYDFGFDKVLAIIDACRNEFNWSQAGTRGAARGFQSSRDIDNATRNNRLVEVIYGCSDREVSYEDEDLGHGVFTDSLLKVIHGHEGELDSHTLSNKANDLMRDWCRRDGQGKNQRAKRYYEPSEQNRIVLLEGPSGPHSPPKPESAAKVQGSDASPGKAPQKPATSTPNQGHRSGLRKAGMVAGLALAAVLALFWHGRRVPTTASTTPLVSQTETTLQLPSRDNASAVTKTPAKAPQSPAHPSPTRSSLPTESVSLVKATMPEQALPTSTKSAPLSEKKPQTTPGNASGFTKTPAKAPQSPAHPSGVKAYVESEEFWYSMLEHFDRIELGRSTTPGNFTDSVTGMEFVPVVGGCYQMGCGPWSWDHSGTYGQPVHEVCVNGFSMGRYEVTQGQWEKVMGTNPSNFKKGDSYPVEMVSWNDAQAFISKLNQQGGRQYRLPTEAEWEYAARSGGKKEKYAGSEKVDTVGWYNTNSGRSTHPVGGKAPNGKGLYDMSGNVHEWCQDGYDSKYYTTSPLNNPIGPSKTHERVVRGGSWDHAPMSLLTSERGAGAPDTRNARGGFRLVLSGQQP